MDDDFDIESIIKSVERGQPDSSPNEGNGEDDDIEAIIRSLDGDLEPNSDQDEAMDEFVSGLEMDRDEVDELLAQEFPDGELPASEDPEHDAVIQAILNETELDVSIDIFPGENDEARRISFAQGEELEAAIEQTAASEHERIQSKADALASSSSSIKSNASNGDGFAVTSATSPVASPPFQLDRRLKNLSRRADLSPTGQADESLVVTGAVKIENRDMVSKLLESNSLHPSEGNGLPVSLAVHPKWIAIGTTRSAVLVFNSKTQKMQMVVKPPHAGKRAAEVEGPVTALDISLSGEHIACGYRCGTVSLFELSSGAFLKSSTERHVSPIAALRFFKRGVLSLVSADTKGIVNLITFSNRFFMWNTDVQCLLDGGAGQIVSLCVASPPPEPSSPTAPARVGTTTPIRRLSQFGSSLGQMVKKEISSSGSPSSLLAIGSFRKTLVVRMAPSPRVVAQWLPPEDIEAASLQSVSWSMPSSPGHPPLLARGWGRKLEIGSLSSLEEDGEEGLIVMDEVSTASPICAVQWLTSSALAYLDTRKQLAVINVNTMQTMEVVDVSSVRLVYAELIPVAAPSKAEQIGCSYSSSVQGCKGKGYLLGRTMLCCVTVQMWSDRVKVLKTSGKWLGALQLALEHFESLKTQTARRRSNSVCSPSTENDDSDIIASLLLEYVEEAFSKNFWNGGKRDFTPAFLSKVQFTAKAAIDYSVTIGRTDLLFEHVYPMFCTAEYENIFLEQLEPYILSGKLRVLPPGVMKAFVALFRGRDKLETVELCLLQLDVTMADIDMLVRTCQKHELFMGLLYVYCEAMSNYVTPLDIMMTVVEDSGRSDQVREDIGYKILLFFTHTLNGKSCFPLGSDPRPQLPLIRATLLRWLFVPHRIGTKALFPNLKSLMNVDASNVMTMLESVFQSDECTFADDPYVERAKLPAGSSFSRQSLSTEDSAKGLADSALSASESAQISRGVSPSVQGMIDCITLLFFPSAMPASQQVLNDPVQFSLKEVQQFYAFASRLAAAAKVALRPVLLMPVLKYLAASAAELASSDSELSPTQREEILLRLLPSVPLEQQIVRPLLGMVDRAAMHRAAVWLFQRIGWFGRAIDAYLGAVEDADFRLQVFDYIRAEVELCKQSSDDRPAPVEEGLMDDDLALSFGGPHSISRSEERLKSIVVERIAELCRLDGKATVELIVSLFPEENEVVVGRLPKHQRFDYLHRIMQAAGGEEAGLQELIAKSKLQITPKMNQLYLPLLCEYQPEGVLKHLTGYQEFSLEDTLALCRQHGILDAEAYVMEIMGDAEGALKLLLSSLDSAVTVYQEHQSPENSIAVKKCVEGAIQLCRRHSLHRKDGSRSPAPDGATADLEESRKVSDEATELWFVLLNEIVDVQEKVFVTFSARCSLLTQCLKQALKRANQFINVTALLHRVVKDRGSVCFEEFRETILNLLSSSLHEKDLLESAERLLEGEQFRQVLRKQRLRIRGFSPSGAVCCVCKRVLTAHSPNKRGRQHLPPLLVVFACQHSFHSDCLHCNDFCPVCSKRRRRLNRRQSSFSPSKAPSSSPPEQASDAGHEYQRRLRLARLRRARHDSIGSSHSGLFVGSEADVNDMLSLAPQGRENWGSEEEEDGVSLPDSDAELEVELPPAPVQQAGLEGDSEEGEEEEREEEGEEIAEEESSEGDDV